MNPNQPPEQNVDNQPPAEVVTPQQPVVVAPVQAAPPTPEEVPVAPVASSPTSPAPIYGQPLTPVNGTTQPPHNHKRRRIIIAALLGLVLIILLSLGAVFGLYLPNKPEGVFKTGMSRTGMALDKIVDDAAGGKAYDQFKKSEISGTYELKIQDARYGGKFSSKFDDKQSNSSVDYKHESQDVSAQVRTDMKDGKLYPDIYVKLSGLSTLGMDEYVPALKDYDGKWISASSDYLASLTAGSEEPKDQSLTQEEIKEMAEAVSSVTREYIFTSNTDKAVIEYKEYVKSEKLDGINTNQYKVSVNKQHAKDYCSALINRIADTKGYTKIAPDKKSDEAVKSATEDCQRSIDTDFKDNETFDLWVDKERKLIHKVRFADPESAGSYVEVGQKYTGGDTIPFFVNYQGGKDSYNGSVAIELNQKTGTTKGNVAFTGSKDDNINLTLSFEQKPHNGDVTIDPPKDAVPLETLLYKLGFTPAPAMGGRQSNVRGAEQRADIQALHTQLEAYYAENGKYPSLTELNSASWRATNMEGLDSEALSAPGQSGASSLVLVANDSSYGYSPRDCNGGCQAYTLAAKLTDGTLYSKESLN